MLTPAELVSLLAAVANGDETAFEKLYAATSAKLYGVVLRILRRPELADEVMQETYLKLTIPVSLSRSCRRTRLRPPSFSASMSQTGP